MEEALRESELGADLLNGAAGHLGGFQLPTTMWLTGSRMSQPASTGPVVVGSSVRARPSIRAEDLRFCDSDPSAHTSGGGHEMTGLVTVFDVAAADGTGDVPSVAPAERTPGVSSGRRPPLRRRRVQGGSRVGSRWRPQIRTTTPLPSKTISVPISALTSTPWTNPVVRFASTSHGVPWSCRVPVKICVAFSFTTSPSTEP